MTHLVCSFCQQIWVFTYKNISTHLYCLYMLSITIQGDARHLIKCCLFSYISTIGNNTGSMSSKIRELKIVQRFNNIK